MVYHFELSHRRLYSISCEHFRRVQNAWADVIRNNGWAVQYFSNHDSARQVSCYGSDGEYRKASAKLLATLLHTTPGTPFIYQGEEIGMTNVKFDSIEDYNCCYTLGDYNSMIKKGVSPKEAIDFLAPRSRDNARTPYQWDASENAGFTSGKPWMKVNPRYNEINLEADLKSPDSIFAYYKKLTEMRKEHPSVIDGDLEFLLPDHPELIVYLRKCARETLLVIANYSDKKVAEAMPEFVEAHSWKRELTNLDSTPPALDGACEWQPWQVEVYSLAR